MILPLPEENKDIIYCADNQLVEKMKRIKISWNEDITQKKYHYFIQQFQCTLKGENNIQSVAKFECPLFNYNVIFETLFPTNETGA